MTGYLAYGLGCFDGERVAARTFEPSPSIEHAVAAYIAAFGDVPSTVKADGRIVWTSRFRNLELTEPAKRATPAIRVQEGCRNCGRKVGHLPNCPRRV
jgi:hypothetical protein